MKTFLYVFFVFIFFIDDSESCLMEKTISGLCYHNDSMQPYYLWNSFEMGEYIQKNRFDCQDSHCFEGGILALANGTNLVFSENGNSVNITLTPSFWGFKPTTELQTKMMKKMIYLEFNFIAQFSENEITWLNCFENLKMKQMIIMLQKWDRNCLEFNFIGVELLMIDGTYRWNVNDRKCLMKVQD